VLLLLALACPADDLATDTSVGEPLDTGDDGGGGSSSVSDSLLTVYGGASSAAGFGIAFGPGTEAEAGDAAWVAGYFLHTVCRFSGQTGTTVLDEAPACVHSPSGDYLGYSLAVGADRVAMGGIGGRTNGTYAGTVYVLPTALPAGLTELDAETPRIEGLSGGDYVGSTVAWLSTAEGERLVVGAPGSDDNGAGSGNAYVFDSVPASGPVNADTARTVIVGSTPPAAVRHGAPEAGDGVGTVLTRAGDLDGDGFDELVIGCNGADDGGANAGIAAIFTSPLPEGVLALRDAPILLTGEVEEQLVGDFVIGLGDTDGDGLGDLAVSGEMGAEGTTWVFASPVTSAVVSAARSRFVGEAMDDLAGASLAGPGDVDGDGNADLFVGAYGSNLAGTDAGAAYLVLGPFPAGTSTLGASGRRWTGELDQDAAGRSVAGGGDYNGDGRGDLLVGAPYSDHGGAFGGAAYVLALP
jgi:hypothetical protein